MLKEIKMPDMGTTSEEIRIVRWLKQEGSRVERGEPLLEVETDKSTMEVESYLSGHLKKIISLEDSSVTAGDVIALIGDEMDTLQDDIPSTAPSERAQPRVNAPAPAGASSHKIRISPMVKGIAEKLGVDLDTITGTGLNGMILKADVEAAAKRQPPPQAAMPGVQVLPFNNIGRNTAKSMTESKAGIPHVYYSVDCSPQQLVDIREENQKRFSYNAMIIKAVAAAIRAFPRAAAAYTPEGVILPTELNIGLAVDIEGDLVVPVVKRADQKTVFEIEEDLRALIEKTREKALRPGDISDGIFTVSNLGGGGVDSFYAVIKPGEAGILAVGRMRKEPVISKDSVIPGLRMFLGLSQDHRVVNGAYSTAFLLRIKEELETWKI